VRHWDADHVATAAGARRVGGTLRAGDEPGPVGVSIDSRRTAPGELFIGLRGERVDGGEHAAQALRVGAWGVLVRPEHARAAAAAASDADHAGGVVLAHSDPLEGLQALAQTWRAELAAAGTKVVAITGSTGKTSTKDILAALLAQHVRVVASPENFNTEIGMPLALLGAPADTQVLVIEMAMRGAAQIAELTAIARPDVGVIVNVGPVHLELLGSLEAIAAAKAELISGLAPGATVVLPAGEPLLTPHLRADLRTLTFGPGGDVALQDSRAGAEASGDRSAREAVGRLGADGEIVVRVRAPTAGDEGAGDDASLTLQPSFGQAHNLRNLLAAVAASRALGISPQGVLDVRFSALRGERLALPGGVVLINDCYNANPMSMRAAIDDLAETAPARQVAVLGDMLELGPGAARFHREIGAYAAERGVELLVTVGPLAAAMREGFSGETHCVEDARAAAELLGAQLRDGDTVLVKGSRGVGLEHVGEALGATPKSAGEPVDGARVDPLAAGSRRR
jgi:UDP-N-acetylmuramoyl-tripeptide--D-alanyl-D-alanine ligase